MNGRVAFLYVQLVLWGFLAPLPVLAAGDAAIECYNAQVEELNRAETAKTSSDVSGAMVAGATSATNLNSQGASTAGVSAGQSGQAAAQASSCASIAQAAKSKVTSCPAKSQTQGQRVQNLIKKQFNPRADSIIESCSQNVAGHSSTSSSLNNMNNSLMMMSAMSALGGMGGGGSSSGSTTTPYNFSSDDSNPDAPAYVPPRVTTSANQRNPVQKVDPATDRDFGTVDELAAGSASQSQAQNAPGRGLAGSPTEVSETSLSTEPAASTSVAALSGPTGEDASVPGASGDQNGINFLETSFSDEKPPAASANEANDAGYQGPNKKTRLSLAAEIAKRKKERAAARAAQRAMAEANARRLATEFVATPRSCAERNWQGPECRALRADPLLQ